MLLYKIGKAKLEGNFTNNSCRMQSKNALPQAVWKNNKPKMVDKVREDRL